MGKPDVKLLMVTADNHNKFYNMHDNEDGTKIDGQRLSWLTNLYNQKNKGKKPELLLEYQDNL